MKLYTTTGDDGTTGLFGGQRISKGDERVETIGAVDELNSVLGLAICVCSHDELKQLLIKLQHELFELGMDLAAPPRNAVDSYKAKTVLRINVSHVTEVERCIDGLSAQLKPLSQFLLPGGGELAGRLHQARAVCRRAERSCVRLAQQQRVGAPVITYLNRLSDLMFSMARRANQLEGVEDVPWQHKHDVE